MRVKRGTNKPLSALQGFTLIELVVALVVLGIAVGIAVPGYRSLVNGNELRASTRDMVSALQLARSEALSRRLDVSLVPVNDDWNAGWQVRYGDNSQHWRPHGETRVAVSDDAAITFVGRTGFLRGSEVAFTFCHADVSGGKKVMLRKTGLVETIDATCT